MCMACYLTDVGPMFVGTIDLSEDRTGCPNKHIKRRFSLCPTRSLKPTHDQPLMAAAPRRSCGKLPAALLAVCWAMPVLPKEEPLLEYGLGIGAVVFED